MDDNIQPIVTENQTDETLNIGVNNSDLKMTTSNNVLKKLYKRPVLMLLVLIFIVAFIISLPDIIDNPFLGLTSLPMIMLVIPLFSAPIVVPMTLIVVIIKNMVKPKLDDK